MKHATLLVYILTTGRFGFDALGFQRQLFVFTHFSFFHLFEITCTNQKRCRRWWALSDQTFIKLVYSQSDWAWEQALIQWKELLVLVVVCLLLSVTSECVSDVSQQCNLVIELLDALYLSFVKWSCIWNGHRGRVLGSMNVNRSFCFVFEQQLSASQETYF